MGLVGDKLGKFGTQDEQLIIEKKHNTGMKSNGKAKRNLG